MSQARPSLDEVRRQLKAQGYLESGMERVIFRASGARGVLWPAAATGAAAYAAALAAALLVRGAIVPAGGAAIFWVVVFVAALLPAIVTVIFLYGLSRILPAPHNPRGMSLAIASLAAVAVAALFAVAVRSLPPGRGPIFAAVVAMAAVLFYFFRALRAAALSLALRRLDAVPPSPPRFRLAAAGLVAAAALASWLASSNGKAPRAQAVSVERGGRVVHVIGLDGVSPEALSLLGGGSPAVWERDAAPPPQIWTTIATGVDPDRHGVSDFDRLWLLREAVLSAPAGSRWLLRGPAARVGISRRLPVSASERRAKSFWEIAAEAGVATVAVNWWASARVSGADVVDNRSIASAGSNGAEIDAAASRIYQLAVARRRPGLATLYLPGADIDGGRISAAAREVVAGEIEKAIGGELTLVLVADGGRVGRKGAVLFRSAGVSTSCSDFRPEDLTPTVLALLGLPGARDFEGRAAAACFAPGVLSVRQIDSYGARQAPAPVMGPTPSDTEYLRKLKSLGYLQ